jgi:hypothetical protein
MFTFISYAPVLERTAAENSSAFADAPQRPETVRAPRTRLVTAALLRRTASLELAVARRLEGRARARLATT